MKIIFLFFIIIFLLFGCATTKGNPIDCHTLNDEITIKLQLMMASGSLELWQEINHLTITALEAGCQCTD